MSKPQSLNILRETVEKRAGYRCEYCQTTMDASTQRLELEHIIPISKDGLTILDNLALSCRGCNGSKYNKTEGLDPVTEEVFPLFNPRKDSWNEHFEWDVNPLYLIGLTPIGRATIETLKLNRPQLIRVRTLLEKLNMHPPDIL